MIKEVENIILEKQYLELTKEELDRVSELVSNQEEFEEMKAFLGGTTALFEESKIKASPDLKKGVLAHLTESRKKKGFWLNSVGVFMFPEGKRIYQKPAFQLGIAALLVVGFLFVFDNSLDEPTLALVDRKTTKNNIELLQKDAETEKTNEKKFSNMQQEENDLMFEDRDQEEVDLLESRVIEKKKNSTELNSAEFFNDDISERDDQVMAEPIADKSVVSVEEEYEELEAAAEVLDNIIQDDKVTTEPVMADEAIKIETVEKLDRQRANKLLRKETISSSSKFKDKEDKRELGKNQEYSQSIDEVGEWLTPKSLHLDETKELKQLFYTEK